MNIPSDVAIRRATLDDAHTLASLGAATFTETFGHLYPAEDLQLFLRESHSVDAWRRTLADSHRAVWLATTIADVTPIGFILVGACKLPVEGREPTAGEIQQLYVSSSSHNLRLGTRLMDLGLGWLAVQGRTPLYIGVWSENFGAQRFYGRYGFEKVGEYGFPVGTTVDREFILKRC
ncbi:MAG TPA: N-acetyltransferase [Steroidobacteraceae bacterium]|nr:N-acetyltransferase [Steroidobacteraceae bacterium]